MPFSSIVRAISHVDHQFVFAAVVWLLAILIAGLVFKRFVQEA